MSSVATFPAHPHTRSGPLVIEFLGAPGAGKTTLLSTAIAALQEQGIHGRTVLQAARPYARRTLVGQVVGQWMPWRWQRPVLWQLFYHQSSLYRLRFFARHPQLLRQVVAGQRNRPDAAGTRQRRVLYWFWRTAGYYEFLIRHGRLGEALLLDEGFIHRVVQLFTSPIETPQSAAIAAYVDQLPQPDCVIFVHAPAEVCYERIYRRGVWEHFRDSSPAEVKRFVEHAACAVELAAGRARHNGWTVLEVDNGGTDLRTAQAALCRQLRTVAQAQYVSQVT